MWPPYRRPRLTGRTGRPAGGGVKAAARAVGEGRILPAEDTSGHIVPSPVMRGTCTTSAAATMATRIVTDRDRIPRPPEEDSCGFRNKSSVDHESGDAPSLID